MKIATKRVKESRVTKRVSEQRLRQRLARTLKSLSKELRRMNGDMKRYEDRHDDAECTRSGEYQAMCMLEYRMESMIDEAKRISNK